MPKVSKASASRVSDFGSGEAREDVVDGYEISFIDLREEVDLGPLLKGLPDDRCPCPHWGYVTAGRVTFTFSDRTEEFAAGDAFYVPPGHTPAGTPDSAYILISPADQIAAVNDAIERNLARQ